MGYKVRHTFTYNGKRHDIRGNSEREVAQKIRALIEKLDAEFTPSVGKDTTVSEYAHYCYETFRRPKVKDITYDRYIRRLESCVLSQIGSMRIGDVKRIDCQNVMNHQIGNSSYQIKQTAQMLRFIFSQAVIDGAIQKNPADGITLPAGKKASRRSLTDEEASIFLQVALADRKFDVFLLSYYCGCRPEEARSAIGSDIITIEGKHLLHIRGTKNSHSDRLVPLQDVIYNRICDTPSESLICPNMAGNKHNDNSYTRAWNNLKREMNIAMGAKVYRSQLIGDLPLADDLVPYCLRHSYCTNLQKAGIDIRTAQKLMGHADIAMTANIYTHVDVSQVLDAADALNRLA